MSSQRTSPLGQKHSPPKFCEPNPTWSASKRCRYGVTRTSAISSPEPQRRMRHTSCTTSSPWCKPNSERAELRTPRCRRRPTPMSRPPDRTRHRRTDSPTCGRPTATSFWFAPSWPTSSAERPAVTTRISSLSRRLSGHSPSPRLGIDRLSARREPHRPDHCHPPGNRGRAGRHDAGRAGGPTPARPGRPKPAPCRRPCRHQFRRWLNDAHLREPHQEA